ncbi:MAG: hypothetical protein K0Q94_6541 [Paenibacillus sp.]|uniref:PH domain-containing protein n=1 Tax=Paenibacillus sp. GCM10012303 TaxID=3317340 RepID=UPI0029ED8BF6|nr:hypothetical protein [Paenibacillus sp.]
MKYGSKKDLWLSIVIWMTAALGVFCGLSPLFVGGAGLLGGAVLFALSFAVSGFMAWIWLGTYYVTTASGIQVRSGPFRKMIPYDSIRKVSSVRSWISSFALSADRVEIHYGQYDMIYLSPSDRTSFVRELQKRCQGITITD